MPRRLLIFPRWLTCLDPRSALIVIGLWGITTGGGVGGPIIGGY